jgi:hypothetical protein
MRKGGNKPARRRLQRLVRPWRGKLCDLFKSSAPLADSLPFVGVRAPRADLSRHPGKKISLLDVATLGDAINNPSGNPGDESHRGLVAVNESTKLRPPASSHAASRLATRGVTSENLGEAADSDLPQTLAITAELRRRQETNVEHGRGLTRIRSAIAG